MTSVPVACLFTVAFLSFPVLSTSHWWFMSQVFSLGAKIMCNLDMSGSYLLSYHQKLCHENPDVIINIGKGAKLGIEECQQQMENERWNCSTVEQDTSVFGKVMQKASQEKAFVHAITSAAVVHQVTRACRRGELRNCSCDEKIDGRSDGELNWGGCSDNIAYGLRTAKLFVDSFEKETDAKAMMNLHNNLVGRRAVKRHTITKCKCHGISDSCEYMTCWRTMAPFHMVGNFLKQKHQHALMVTVDQKSKQLLWARGDFQQKPSRDDLVFLEKFPDYCARNPGTGSLGTTGRICNQNVPEGHGSCDILCCGRGYNTIQVAEEYKCDCTVQWCCQVNCKTCRRIVDRHMCKSPEDNNFVKDIAHN